MSVLIFKGMQVGVQDGDATLSVSEEGEVGARVVLSSSFNIVPIWTLNALESCAAAGKQKSLIDSAWPAGEKEQRDILIKELRYSLVAIVSCAISLDGLYDLVRPHAKVGDRMQLKWKKNRTARHAQVSEVFRRALKLDNETSGQVNIAVKEIMNLRDKAVHPSSALEKTVNRADIPVGVDRAFGDFKYTNALTAYNNTVQLLAMVCRNNSLGQHGEISSLRDSLIETEVFEPGGKGRIFES